MSYYVLLSVLVCVLFKSSDSIVSDSKNGSSTVANATVEDANLIIKEILFGKKAEEISDCFTLSKKSAKRYKNLQIEKTPIESVEPLWTVAILKEDISFNNNKTLRVHQCTGSLIHPKVVLTAAHCLYSKPINQLKVRAGETKQTSVIQERRVESIVFQRKSSNPPKRPKADIALVFLEEPFDISDDVRTVCIPPHKVEAINVRCSITGWEQKDDLLNGYANFKQIHLPIVSNERCEKVLRLTGLGSDFNLHKSLMCTGGQAAVDQSVLKGNGGAPLVCQVCGVKGRMIQVGVLSWGFETAPLPEVFTFVRSARKLITEEFKKKNLTLSNCGIN